MDNKLKKIVLWTIYILAIIIAIFTLIALGVNILAPTFFPKTNIDGFKNYINTFCVILSFLSIGLGIYSIKQAETSGKQMSEMIDSLKEIRQQQEILVVSLKNYGDVKVNETIKKSKQWSKDNNTE